MNKFTILIIDDDIEFSEWLKIGLSLEGYNVLTATTAKDGLDLLNTNRVDLIILDLILPDITLEEFGLLKRLKQQYNEIPVIVVSGIYKKDENIQKAYELGADGYLIKPFSYDLLSVKIKKLLYKV